MDDIENPIEGSATVISSLKGWASLPFKQPQNLTDWFLWTGLILVFIIAWIFILRELESI